MKVLRVFFVGLIYGWLLRWVVDKIFMEDNLRALANENEILRQRIITLETPKTRTDRPTTMQQTASLPVEKTEPAAKRKTSSVPPQRDDLKMIKGIGPILEKNLNDAGIYTFKQMSQLTSDQLQAIFGESRRNLQNADNLISQAKKFAKAGSKG